MEVLTLEEAVATLPKSRDPHDVYVFLHEKSVRGSSGSSCDCPIARYVSDLVGRRIVADYQGGGITAGSVFPDFYEPDQDSEELPLPLGVVKFMHLFDVYPWKYKGVWDRQETF